MIRARVYTCLYNIVLVAFLSLSDFLDENLNLFNAGKQIVTQKEAANFCIHFAYSEIFCIFAV